MDNTAREALLTDPVVDITTRGRTSGSPRRIEIWIHAVAGRYYVTGRPGRRSWYANLLANPELTVHLKGSVEADLPARARPITDPDEKLQTLIAMERLRNVVSREDLKGWVTGSPLVEVEFDGGAS